MRSISELILISLLLRVGSPSGVLSASLNSVDSLDEELLLKWTTNALKFFDFHRCVQVSLAEDGECFRLSQVRRQQIAVYVGRAKMDNVDPMFLYNSLGMKASGGSLLPGGGRKKVLALLPDSGDFKEAQASHDVILALDPYPNYNFGHLVGLFYIDFGVEERLCREEDQILTSDQTCITMARKTRCPNQMERRTASYLSKRCHIDFLPTVHLAGLSQGTVLSPSGEEYVPNDLLECVRIPGFASCPKLRPMEDTERILCDAANVNSKRCDTSYTGVGTRCRLFQTCDRAILVGGGWNRLHSGTQSLLNVFKLNSMLQRNGFQRENVKIFYANGGQPAGDGESRTMLSSAMKTGLRGHLRTICEARHCADTLFIYLNNPTTVEGDMLLWDVDSNGLANELEIYTTKEFLSDLSSCQAQRVVLVVEQSNSDLLINTIKDSAMHQNVAIFATGSSGSINVNGEMSDIWANHSHPTYCLQHLQDTCKRKMKIAPPVMYDNSVHSSSKFSIIGAPCDVNPPLTQRELHSLYQGCQNVPTSVWFSLSYEAPTSPGNEDPDEDEDALSDENSPKNRRLQK